MKTRRSVFLILGCLFAGCNLFLYIDFASKHALGPPPESGGSVSYIFGYYFALNILLLIGLIFLYIAYRADKTIKRRKKGPSTFSAPP